MSVFFRFFQDPIFGIIFVSKKGKREMKNKIFLSSMLIMSVAPAMAEPSNTGEFPTGGLMQEDYTYTNAATSTNMDGVYEGSVNATAEYEDVLYQIAAGQYLPAGAESPIDCNVAGSFCAGVQNGVYYDANNNQGLTSCSDATNGAYTLSAGTGDSVNSCYRECTNADVAHSKGTLNGGYYYGDNNQCEPTDCFDGWHVKAGVNGSAIATAIGTGEGENRASINGAGTFKQQTYGGTDRAQAFYGLTDNNTWAVYYDSTHGMLTGQARCSTQSGSLGEMSNGTYPDITTFASLTDETGQEGAKYCYCNVTGYKDTNGNLQSLSSPWVFRSDLFGVSGCANSCADYCASYMRGANSGNLAYRAAVFGSIESSPAMCEANTITINWSNADAADISANNAGTATYGSDVRTPVKAQTIKGKTFRGWRFSKPQQTTTGN